MAIKNRTSNIIDNLLMVVAASSTVALTVIAPNSLIALEKPLTKLLDGIDNRKEARRIGQYLKQQKLVQVSKNPDGSFKVSLTKNGKTRALKAYFEQLTIPKEPWDLQWRIVMFDIPEKHKTTRDFISQHLKRAGFRPLQRSVFIFPYPADSFLAVLREIIPQAAPYIIALTVSEIDNHNALVKRFSHILH